MDDPPSLHQALPRDLLALTIAHHMPHKSDVKQLSLTCRSVFSLVRSPDLIAAWLWQQRGNDALFLAMLNNDMVTWRCSRSSSKFSMPTSTLSIATKVFVCFT